MAIVHVVRKLVSGGGEFHISVSGTPLAVVRAAADPSPMIAPSDE